MTTRDKIEFTLLMGQHTSATVRDILALMRYASAYLSAPNTARRERMERNMNKVCALIGVGLKPGLGIVYVVTKDLEIRIPV